MEFKKTITLYEKYKKKTFIYDSVESNKREDEELLNTFTYLPPLTDEPIHIDLANDNKRYLFLIQIQETFDHEFQQYIDDDIYFYACSFKVYKETYYKRLENFINKYPDSTEIEFIDNDLNTIEPYTNIPIKLSDEQLEKNKYSHRRRIEFLTEKLRKTGCDLLLNNEKSFEITKYNINKQTRSSDTFNDVSTDLSNTIGTEKIIMLHKLGVLDFLKEKPPFNLSTNSLASVISGITGIKQSSVYPMINPIFSPTNKQKNNPLKTEKTVSSVVQKLISIGYKPED